MSVRILANDLRDPGLQAMLDGHARHLPDLKGMAGTMKINSLILPGMAMLDVAWQTPDHQLEVCDHEPSQNINIQFQLSGRMKADFKGLNHLLDMGPGRHNLICVPEEGDKTLIPPNSSLEMMHISIDREYFRSLIGEGSAWAEQVQRELAANRPFSGIRETAATTPAMKHLINDIRNPNLAPKPMQNLLRQARLLELLSLQLEQFTAACGNVPTRKLSVDDAERIHQVKKYLDDHYLEQNLSLAGLSRRFQLNEFKLKSGFKQCFQTSVFAYVGQLRMLYACRSLREGKSSEEVAYLLGYEYPQHFSAAFKRHFGQTPSRWAKSGRA